MPRDFINVRIISGMSMCLRLDFLFSKSSGVQIGIFLDLTTGEGGGGGGGRVGPHRILDSMRPLWLGFMTPVSVQGTL